MKTIIKNHLKRMNDTTFRIFRYYNPNIQNKSRWTIVFDYGNSYTYNYDNKLEWNGLIRD